MREIFRNRIEAGQLLAGKLMRYANQPNVIVLGLPRGGLQRDLRAVGESDQVRAYDPQRRHQGEGEIGRAHV